MSVRGFLNRAEVCALTLCTCIAVVGASAEDRRTPFIVLQPEAFAGPGALADAWADYDADGDLDLAVTYVSGEVRLYRNERGVFVNVGADIGLPVKGDPARGVSWGDFDGDGYPDLYVGTAATPAGTRNFLYRNQSGRRFVEVAQELGAAAPGVSSRQSSWIDYDADGDLDLFVAHRAGNNFLLRNDRGRFIDVADQLGLSDVRRTVGACWFDMDRDGDLDLFLANQEGDKDALYRNDGRTFVDVAPELGMDRPHRRLAEGGVGCAVGDYDNDGDLDLFVATYGTSLLYRNEGHGRFTEQAVKMGLALEGHNVGASWGDFDNDGRLDLYVAGYVEGEGGTRADGQLFRNDGVTFGRVPLDLVGSGNHGVQWADFDGDGDLDLALTDSSKEGGRALLLRNELPERDRKRSLQVGVLDARGRYTRAGAEVRILGRGDKLLATRIVPTGDGYDSQSVTPVHFGLATAEPVTIEVSFMSTQGVRKQYVRGVNPLAWTGRAVVVREGTASESRSSRAAVRTPQPAPESTLSLERRIDALFDEYVKSGSPGVAVAVYRNAKPVYLKGIGLANLESGAPLGPRTPFHVASVSKQFTAFSIALLEEDGRLTARDDVRKYLPDVPDFGKRIELRHLIHHTSGLRDQWDLFELAGRNLQDFLTQGQIRSMVSRQTALNFAPGEQYLYSNTGYTLLADVVNAASGLTLRRFAEERIFGPLGMRDTFFNDEVSQVVPGRAESYRRGKDGSWRRALLSYDTVGATSLVSTVEDLSRWAANFYETRLGTTALMRRLSEPAATNDGASVRYGYGLIRLRIAGHEAVMHTGSDAGFRSFFAVFPAERLSIVALSNASLDVDASAEAIAELILNGKNGRTPPPAQMRGKPLMAQLRATAGHYIGPWGQMIEIGVSPAGNLLWQSGPGRSQELRYIGDSDWDTGSTTYGYYRIREARRGAATQVEEVSVLDEQHPAIYRRIEPVRPTQSDLWSIAGDYRCPELDTTYRLAVEEGHLVARSMWSPHAVAFEPTEPDRFASARGAIRLRRDAAGHPIGFELSWDRVRGLNFYRLTAP